MSRVSALRACAALGILVFVLAVASGGPRLPQVSASSQDPSADELPLQVIVVRSAEEAQQVLERLKAGEDFAAVAKEKSIDPSASAGGYMGKFAPRMLRAELRDVLPGVEPGQVSKVAHIPEGYAILKVMSGPPGTAEKVDPAGTLALAARGSVKQMLLVSGLPEAEAAFGRFPKPED